MCEREKIHETQNDVIGLFSEPERDILSQIEQTQPPSPPAVQVSALSSQSPPSHSPQVQGPVVFSFHIFNDQFVTNNNPTEMS